jgi:hypothetical protein
MSKNTLPGFGAEASLARTPGWHTPRVAQPQRHAAVHPAALDPDCYDDCYGGCMEFCVGPGRGRDACVNRCRQKSIQCRRQCGGGSPGGPGGGVGGGGLAIYGNYCGPGHGTGTGDPTGQTPPVDEVDAVCRAHDLCYDATHYSNCGCDRALLLSMPAAIEATPSDEGKRAGFNIASFFSAAPCTCIPSWCLYPGVCFPLPPVPGIGGVGVC